MFALAHATGKIGRFTLIERWRNNERLLAPNENPLKVNRVFRFIMPKREESTFAINVPIFAIWNRFFDHFLYVLIFHTDFDEMG